jgi:hypothetical protein
MKKCAGKRKTCQSAAKSTKAKYYKSAKSRIRGLDISYVFE